MVFKLKDLLNKKMNKRNHQISLDVKKRELKKFAISVDDLLEIPLSKKLKRFEEGDFD